MRDELYDREYQAGRAALHDGIDRAVTAIGRRVVSTFETFHDIQFAAPWQRTGKSKPGGNRTGLA